MTDIGVSMFRFENNRGYGVPDINARYVESVKGVRLADLAQRRAAAAPPRHPHLSARSFEPTAGVDQYAGVGG